MIMKPAARTTRSAQLGVDEVALARPQEGKRKPLGLLPSYNMGSGGERRVPNTRMRVRAPASLQLTTGWGDAYSTSNLTRVYVRA